jgi:hypothetical protein
MRTELYIQLGSFFYEEKIDKFRQIYCKCVNEKSDKWSKSNTLFFAASLRTYVIAFCYGSGSAKAKSFGSGSATLLCTVNLGNFVSH